MKLIDVLRKECVVAGVQLSNKAEALSEIVRVAKKSPILKDVSEKEIFAELESREALGSTGIGKGIAIPHCRLKSVPEFVMGIITVPSGVDFNALDEQKVNLLIFIIAPKAESNQHVKLLSVISQTLLMPGAIEELLAQDTAASLRQCFLSRAASDIEADGESGKSLLHVFVQDESIFKEILQVLTGIPSSSLVVTSVENTSAYLMKIPLFAEFWSDEPSRFSKIIVAVIGRDMTNEAIRRIESVTGDLNKSNSAMMTVQDVSFAAGSLGT